MTEVNLTGTLRNWSYTEYANGKIANGDLYGDAKQRWRDGTYIHTSLIMSGPDENGIIVTRNSVYKLEGPSLAEQFAEKGITLKSMDAPGLF